MKKLNSNQNVKVEKMAVFVGTFDYYHHKFKGKLHSNYIFLPFALIGLEWDSITLFTKMSFFSSKTHISIPHKQVIYGLLFINMNTF